MNKNSLKLLILVLLLVGLGSQVKPSAAQTNLLQNPGFELPYNSDGSANGWGRWFRVSSADRFNDCANGYHKEPHWNAETVSAPLIQAGSASQHVGNNWDTWAAGVLQTVTVKPGSTYRFTVWARGRGSNDDYPAPSEGGLRMDIMVGIDPNGSGLWNDADVKWSGFIQPHDTWQQVSVEVTATGDKVSVFTAGDYGLEGVNQCRKHLDVWFDSAELIEVGPPPTNTPVPQPTSPPPPPATSTPIPTATLVPTETPVPTEVPTETPTTPAGATLCVNAFADDNGNGQKDANEGFMGSVSFRVANSSQVVAQAVSSGTSEPVCFEGLEPGAYQVEQIVPGPLEMTTASNATVNVEAGQTAGVQFGSRIRMDSVTDTSDQPDEVADAGNPDVAATAVVVDETDTAVPEAESGGLGSYSGLILLVVAVILLGGILFVVLRRTA